ISVTAPQRPHRMPIPSRFDAEQCRARTEEPHAQMMSPGSEPMTTGSSPRWMKCGRPVTSDRHPAEQILEPTLPALLYDRDLPGLGVGAQGGTLTEALGLLRRVQHPGRLVRLAPVQQLVDERIVGSPDPRVRIDLPADVRGRGGANLLQQRLLSGAVASLRRAE